MMSIASMTAAVTMMGWTTSVLANHSVMMRIGVGKMVEVTVKKARKLKSPIIVRHKGEWCDVEEIRAWGKNWMVITDEEDFVVADTYHGLFRVTQGERANLLGS